MKKTFLMLCRFFKATNQLNFDTVSEELVKRVEKKRKETKLLYISRIFRYDSFLEVDQKELKKNPYYYNDLFDKLYDLSVEELEIYDQRMDKIVDDYEQSLIQTQTN